MFPDFCSAHLIQNWITFGKIAKDIVMRMQKIDSNNYPEVPQLLFPHKRKCELLLVRVGDIFSLSCSDIASNVHSECG